MKIARANYKKIIIVFIIAALIIYLANHPVLTLDNLKLKHIALQTMYQDHPILFIFSFFFTYVLSCALSIPGAIILTLASGVFFGFSLGLVIASFASTVGATLAFLISRFLLQDWVRKTFPKEWSKVQKGVERDGAYYLFTLRLVPIAPYVVTNLVMGLMGISTLTFYWVSQLGMLPATIIYINAGTRLSEIKDLSGLFSPQVVMSFVSIGIFPFLAKRLVSAVRKRTSHE